MRRKVTVNLDESFVAMLDAARGHVPRSRYLEQLALAEGESATSQVNYARTMLAVSQGADTENGPLVIKPPAKDERSPEPRTEFQAATDDILDDLHSGPITEQLETPRAKPPLQRPIIQKRGT